MVLSTHNLIFESPLRAKLSSIAHGDSKRSILRYLIWTVVRTNSELLRKVASIERTGPADIGKLCERYKVTHSSELSAPTMEVGV